MLRRRVVVAQPSARHRVGGGAASPVCVVTPESRPRRALGDALAAEEAVVVEDRPLEHERAFDRVALEARPARGGLTIG
eukprot:scaffold55379_cov63-Phaeocystis_antarctica.AAC.3